MKDYGDEIRLSIRKWSAEERPREKLMTLGSSGVSTAELVAIILGNGTRTASALELGRQVLARYNNSLHLLGEASVQDLMKIKGIGMASATRIVSALMLGRRHRSGIQPGKVKISTSQEAYELIAPHLSALRHEEFWISLLSRANMVLNTLQISKGSLAGTVVDIKKIYGLVVQYRASGIILYHNHPSGATNPSENDRELTRRITHLAGVMEVMILDHLIVGDEKYFSFADHGLL
jgi:DNA repair protein RadC